MRVLLLLIVLPLAGQQSSSDQVAIRTAQETLVSTLDAALPRQPLLQWLRQSLQPVKIEWEVSDCGEQSGNPDLDRGRDFPLCVEVTAALSGNRTATIALLLGTFQRGITGAAVIASIHLKNGARLDLIPKLHELPARAW